MYTIQPNVCAPRPSHSYLCVIENAASVVGADDGVFAVLAEVGCSDEARLTVHLVPQSHLLFRNIPQAQLTIQRAAQKIPVVLHHTGTDIPHSLSQTRMVEVDTHTLARALALTLGWKAMAVTKSICWKQQRHSRLDMCHKRTVLSMDDDNRK